MIQTAKELAAACEDVARNHKSVYVNGAFGWPMTEANKQRALNAYAFNRKAVRKAAIQAASANTFGFDCICFIKALLWGWEGATGKEYGGAKYQSNGVPDIGEKAMLNACADVNADFSKIQVGEYLWTDGHCGIYVGGGRAIECTYRWDDGVQETSVFNIAGEKGKGRYWKKHGKLPYVTYEEEIVKGDYTMEMRNLYQGCVGGDVRALQILLKGNGYDLGTAGKNRDGVDGDFGAKTKAAVVSYQVIQGLEADGIVGKKTMSRLLGV